jgi:hypothetical protein
MMELTLIADGNYQVKPLVEAALDHELRLLEAGIRQTESRLRGFEEKYQRPTADFLAAYEHDQYEETLDFIEWIGEYHLLKRLHEKTEALRSIHFAN